MADSMTFTINLSKSTGKITSVSIKDNTSGITYTATGTSGSNMTWNIQPTVTAGSTFTLSVTAKSATAGNMTVIVTCTADTSLYYRKTATVPANGTIMITDATWTMPSASTTSISITVNDN
jgi:hypothetical protein